VRDQARVAGGPAIGELAHRGTLRDRCSHPGDMRLFAARRMRGSRSQPGGMAAGLPWDLATLELSEAREDVVGEALVVVLSHHPPGPDA
jgi:hypothetical protein